MDNPAYVNDCERELGTGAGAGVAKRAHSFEEAIQLAGVGCFHYKLLLVCGLCFMAVMGEIMGVSLILPLLRCDLQPTLAQQGLLASAGFLGVVFSSHAMGFLADTWGRVTTLRSAMALSVVCSLVSAFSVNIWMLIVCRFLTGFFISGGQAIVFSLCGEFHGNASRVRHVTLLSGFLCLSLMVEPSLAMAILPLRIEASLLGLRLVSWRLLLMANAVVSVVAIAGLFLLPETPKYMVAQGNNAAALDTLRAIYAQNTRRPQAEYPVQQLTAQSSGSNLSKVSGCSDALRLIWRQTVPLFYRERLLHTLNICLIQFVIYGIAQGLFMWVPTILNQLSSGPSRELCSVLQDLDVGAQAAAGAACGIVDLTTYQVLIIIGAVFTVVYLIFAFTIDHVGKRNLLLFWLLLSIICLVALHWLQQFTLVVIALTVVVAIGNCGGLVSTIALEFYPTHINAMGMCFVMMVGRLGAVVGSNLLGRLLFASCDVVFWALLGAVVLLSVMAWFLPEQRKTKPTQ